MPYDVSKRTEAKTVSRTITIIDSKGETHVNEKITSTLTVRWYASFVRTSEIASENEHALIFQDRSRTILLTDVTFSSELPFSENPEPSDITRARIASWTGYNIKKDGTLGAKVGDPRWGTGLASLVQDTIRTFISEFEAALPKAGA